MDYFLYYWSVVNIYIYTHRNKSVVLTINTLTVCICFCLILKMVLFDTLQNILSNVKKKGPNCYTSLTIFFSKCVGTFIGLWKRMFNLWWKIL